MIMPDDIVLNLKRDPKLVIAELRAEVELLLGDRNRLQRLNESLVVRAGDNSEFLTRMAEQKALLWTGTPPKEVGWYWWKRSDRDSAYAVYKVEPNSKRNGLWVFFHPHGKSFWSTVEDIGGHWAGPLMEPPNHLTDAEKEAIDPTHECVCGHLRNQHRPAEKDGHTILKCILCECEKYSHAN
jgi:hypothetical protein